MAKRTIKSQPNDIASSSDVPKPAGRGRSRATTTQPDAVMPERAAEAVDSADASLQADQGSTPAPPRRESSEQLSSSREDARRSTSMGSEPSEEDIRMRAYHLYIERGAEPGQHEDDWLRAERELKKRA